jgi:hypothetical protein
MIPLIIISIGTFLQLILSIFKIKGKLKMPFWDINLVSMGVGLLFLITVTLISIFAMPPGAKCITGEVNFLIGSFLITLATTPLIWGCCFLIYHFKNK